MGEFIINGRKLISNQEPIINDYILGIGYNRELMGGRKPTVSDDKILQAVAEHEADVIVASDLEDALDMGKRGVLPRLTDIAETTDYLVMLEKPSVKVFYLSQEGREYVASIQGTDLGSQ